MINMSEVRVALGNQESYLAPAIGKFNMVALGTVDQSRSYRASPGTLALTAHVMVIIHFQECTTRDTGK